MAFTKEERKARAQEASWHRQAVCRRCHAIMNDAEPHISGGEFCHPETFKNGKHNPCPNAGHSLDFVNDPAELELFVPKKLRRNAKRLGSFVLD